MAENIIVTVSGDTQRIAEQLRAAGMNVQRVLVEIGIVTGSVDAGRRASLAAIPGVVAVETEGTVHTAPVDAGAEPVDHGHESVRPPSQPESE